MKQIQYEKPEPPLLLTISAFIYLLNLAEALLNHLLNAGLIGSLTVGIIFGPQAADILPIYIQETFIVVGYIGLVLLVFEAGLSTNISLAFHNIFLSFAAALTGVALPILFSILLFKFGFHYTTLQAFAAGAALCSTSLGTTLALLNPEIRQTRTGSVLLSAALIDDIIGLVIAGVISNLGSSEGTGHVISWQLIVRPISVSFAFAIGTPLVAFLLRKIFLKLSLHYQKQISAPQIQLFVSVTMISGFVAGARYAGTSELFGAYLSGVFLSHIFSFSPASAEELNNTASGLNSSLQPTEDAFNKYLLMPLRVIFSPIFFASIGTALPIRAMISVDGSHRVVWRGIVYSIIMMAGKFAVGVWMLPMRCSPGGKKKSIPRRQIERNSKTRKDCPPSEQVLENETFSPSPSSSVAELSTFRSVMLLGTAMIARGEIALIVAQLARPILVDDATKASSEPYSVVIWAILVTTVGGALGVGILLKR